MDEFNAITFSQLELRQKLLVEMLSGVGENCYLELPFHGNFFDGGKRIDYEIL